MPLAELHGKVLAEDTLTSGAIGLLTVLPARWIWEWFTRAHRKDGSTLAIPPPASVDAAFWPQLEGGACEPDVLFSFMNADRQVFGVLVEIKFKSDMSGWPTPVDSDPEVRSQLGREWLALRSAPAHLFGGAAKTHTRALLYVTTGTTLPTSTFDVVAQELEDKGGDREGFLQSAYWVSWFTLAEVVREALGLELAHPERVALMRLYALLKHRRLVTFSGIEAPAVAPIGWAYESTVIRYPTQPAASTVAWAYSR